jgi:membrane-associated phospholipid phosphatase
MWVCPSGLRAGEPENGEPVFERPAVNYQPAPPSKNSLKDLPLQVLKDQKVIWIEPFRVDSRRDLYLRSAVVGTSAGLLFLDRPVGQELSGTPPGAGYRFSKRVETYGGGLADIGVASAFYLTGKWSGNERARETGVLSFRALTDAFIVVEVLKTTTRRPRPTHADGTLRTHNADGEFFTGGRSFPSGHATEAWALATVVAHQYSHRRWVPPTSYGLAGLVAVSRVTDRAHFPTDVFVGSLIGYLIGRQVFRSNQQESGQNNGGVQFSQMVTPQGSVGIRLQWTF